MKILIYGGGAVGLGVASCLIKSGQEVDVIASDQTASLLSGEGLAREGIFGTHHAGPGTFRACSSLDDLPGGAYDFVIVSTKAHDSKEAARDLSSHPRLLGDRANIVLFQNGWGGAQLFTAFFPAERVFNARVITGFIRPRKNRVVVTVHADAIRIGNLFADVPSGLDALCEAISAGGIPCSVTPSVGRDLWAKMLYNCALNALGAIFEVPYGVLGAFPHTREVMGRVVEEVFLVMQRAGNETHWESATDYLDAFYGTLLPPTAEHESSMLQDIREGKKTEIDFLNGAVVSLGRDAGVDTPVNLVLWDMVKFLEARSASR